MLPSRPGVLRASKSLLSPSQASRPRLWQPPLRVKNAAAEPVSGACGRCSRRQRRLRMRAPVTSTRSACVTTCVASQVIVAPGARLTTGIAGVQTSVSASGSDTDTSLTVTLPLFADMVDADVECVCAAAAEVLREGRR